MAKYTTKTYVKMQRSLERNLETEQEKILILGEKANELMKDVDINVCLEIIELACVLQKNYSEKDPNKILKIMNDYKKREVSREQRKEINKEDRIKIGNRIKDIRRKNKLTYFEFGKKLNVSSGTVYNWESGMYTPNKKRLAIISNLGETTIEYILYGKYE